MLGFTTDLNMFLLLEAAALVSYKSQLNAFFPMTLYKEFLLPDLVHMWGNQPDRLRQLQLVFRQTLHRPDRLDGTVGPDVRPGGLTRA